MGAWIEIEEGYKQGNVLIVAPYMGAWIEILILLSILNFSKSHPTWVRGLKS